MTYQRPTIKLKSEDFQAMVYDFIGVHKNWTSFEKDKIEHILAYHLRKRRGITASYYYTGFNTATEELIFQGEAEFIPQDGYTVKEIDRSQETFNPSKLLTEGKNE